MPKCVNCSKTQAKLNNGQLCKECFIMVENKENNNLASQFNADSYDSSVNASASALIAQDETTKLTPIQSLLIENRSLPDIATAVINEQFDKLLINRVKDIVKVEMQAFISVNAINSVSPDTSDVNLIKSLQNEILFLKSELVSKDKTIELLLNPTEAANKINNHDMATKDIPEDICWRVVPPTTNKKKQLRKKSNTDIKLSNRFDGLNCENYPSDLPTSPTYHVNITKEPIRKNPKRRITILGDSMLKSIKQHGLRDSVSRNDQIYLKLFSGSNISDMHDYMKPTLKHSPDLVLLHIGTNELWSKKRCPANCRRNYRFGRPC